MLPVAILAGGLATRLRPLTETIPKALIDISGEPFLAHQLRLLNRAGIRRIVMCVGYKGEQIRDFAGDGSRFGLHVEYSFDGPVLLGTAGALRQALPLLGPAFFVLYGDSYLPCDYHAVERHFETSEKLGLMTVFHNAGNWDASNVEFSDGRILEYEKRNRTSRMRYIDYGLGMFRDRVFHELSDPGPHDLATVYANLLKRDELAAFEVEQRFYEIGSHAGIVELNDYLTQSQPAARAVFLDRDGVLNEAILRDGRPYPPAGLEELRLVPDAEEALAQLKAAGFDLVVVTNQPDVARGVQSIAGVEAINAALSATLPIDEFCVCFHADSDHCVCRKPQPGLLKDAAVRRGIDLQRSFMIGDRWRDIDAGAAAGCRTILIDRQYHERGPDHAPDCRVTSLAAAIEWILAAPEQP